MLKDKRRPDGRKFDQVRNIDVEVGVLPRTHGSALFTRGETQALVTATLGTKDDEQRIELLDSSETSKRFMLHYTLLPAEFQRRRSWIHAWSRQTRDQARRTCRASSGCGHSRRQSIPVHHASGERHHGIERFQFHGDGLRRDSTRW